jgi:ethanolamine utilization cobalamin adenosyltransferase
MPVSVLTEAALRILLKDEDLDVLKEYKVGADVIVTPSAKAYLTDHRIDLLVGDKRVIRCPGNSEPVRKDPVPNPGVRDETASGGKPEYMTSLKGTVLVCKDNKIIRLRGKIDSFEAKLLETQLAFIRHNCAKQAEDLGEVLGYTRAVMRAEVLDDAVPPMKLFGLDEAEIRDRSHEPRKYYGVPHFMPLTVDDGEVVLMVNVLRTMIRETELVAYEAFRGESGVPEREDIVMALNRLSSALYVIMLKEKAGEYAS